MFSEPTWFNPGGAAFDPTLIGNSVWLDGSADFLSKTFSSGSAQTRLVFAAWVQRNSFTSTDQAIFSGLKNISGTNLVNRFVWHASDDMIEIHIEDVNAATIAYKTSRVFRDIGWYHLILSIDSNETDSVQLYVNGVRETTLALTSGSALSAAPAAWGNAGLHTIGAYNNGASNYSFLNNYVAQATMLVGQSIQNSDVAVTDFLESYSYGSNGSQFGPKSGVAALASSAGGNSFCLDFANSTNLGASTSSIENSVGSGATMPGATGTNIGNMTGNGGLAAAFDTTHHTSSGTSANVSGTEGYVGKNWNGRSTIIDSVSIFPPDTYTGKFFRGSSEGQLRLYGSNSAPSSGTDGTLLADSGVISTTGFGSSNAFSFSSSDITTTTAYTYHWMTLTDTVSHDIYVGQLDWTATKVFNDLTPTSMSAANQSTNTPSLSYAALNILDKGSSATTSEGATRQPTGTDHVILSSMQIPPTGKWAISGRVDVADFSFGICTPAHTRTSKIGRTNDSWGAIDSPGASFFRSEHDSVGSNSTSAVSAASDTFIIAFDADSGKLWLGRNDGGAGIAYLGGGNPATGATPTYTLSASEMSPGLHFAVGNRLTVSFGQRAHFETLPTDFLELNSANLPTPDYQGVDLFSSTLYTGNGTAIGSGGLTVSNDIFSPALVWIKNRDATDDHAWYDTPRGVTKQIESNTQTIESTEAEGVTAFTSTGFTVGNLAQVNTNAEKYVAWQWAAGTAFSGDGSGGAAGTVASSGVVADAGNFSIFKFVANSGSAYTAKHGLSAAPEFFVVKHSGTSGSAWVAYAQHAASDAETDYIIFDGDGAMVDDASVWNDTAPTSAVISIGTNSTINNGTAAMIGYAWRSVPGVCRVGSYTGNSSDDGPHLSLGFRPAWFIVKCSSFSDASHDWFVADSSRYTFNGTTTTTSGTLEANEATAEEAHSTNFGDNPAFDFLADSIKIRSNSGTINATGRTYIYIAMADIASGAGLCPIFGR